MANACIAIGIERTAGQGLGRLPGAVNGARAIAEWARAAGYSTELVTDRADDDTFADVDITRIRDAMMRLLPKADDDVDRGGPNEPPGRLIVYFAGHGMQSAAFGELWLLSNSYDDQSAIGIANLQAMLQTYVTGEKPGQIAIISDACRSPMIASWNVNILPAPVVPRGPFDPNTFDQVDIDQYLAVPQLSSAFMVRATETSPARCIFTSVLLEALHGTDDACFEADNITSDSLARYLRTNVPLRARQYDVDMRPRVFPCWIGPDDIYMSRQQLAGMNLPELDRWPGEGAASGQDAPPPDIFESFGAPKGVVRGDGDALYDMAAPVERGDDAAGWAGAEEPPVEENAPTVPMMNAEDLAQAVTEAEAATALHRARDSHAGALLSIAARADRATHYESLCGLTLSGSEPTATISAASGFRIEPDENFVGSWRVWGPQGPLQSDQSTWLIARFEDGRSLASCVSGGFITDCIFTCEGGLVASLRPLHLDRAIPLLSQDILARGLLADSDADDALGWLAKLAQDPFDPMLGVLAAYQFNAAGQQDNVRRLVPIYAARGMALPFDIAVLAGATVVQGTDRTLVVQVGGVRARKPRTKQQRQMVRILGEIGETTVAVAGRYPLLRQGWSLLDYASPGLVPHGLSALVPHLTSAPFATLDATGSEQLLRIVGEFS